MSIFLDHNSTTPMLDIAYKAMKPYFCDYFYNSSGLQNPCREIAETIENARTDLRKLVSFNAGLLIFTSSATEANNFVICQNIFHKIITIPIEHPSVINAARRYHGTDVIYSKIDSDGIVDLDDLKINLIKNYQTDKKILVSIQYANQVIHSIQPMKEISDLCKKYGAYLHVDATQAFGKLPITNISADFITISSHKCYGPKGIAALWISKNIDLTKIKSLMCGGHQEFNLRAGTLNVPAIIGFHRAAQFMYSNYDEHFLSVSRLTSKFYNEFTKLVPDCFLNGSITQRLPGGLHFTVPNVDMRSVLLSLPNIIISTGMSCSSYESDPVLTSIGKKQQTRNSFRIQVGFENTEDEIHEAVVELSKKILEARSFWGNYSS